MYSLMLGIILFIPLWKICPSFDRWWTIRYIQSSCGKSSFSLGKTNGIPKLLHLLADRPLWSVTRYKEKKYIYTYTQKQLPSSPSITSICQNIKMWRIQLRNARANIPFLQCCQTWSPRIDGETRHFSWDMGRYKVWWAQDVGPGQYAEFYLWYFGGVTVNKESCKQMQIATCRGQLALQEAGDTLAHSRLGHTRIYNIDLTYRAERWHGPLDIIHRLV